MASTRHLEGPPKDGELDIPAPSDVPPKLEGAPESEDDDELDPFVPEPDALSLSE
jgi:hypothetical protein